MSTVHGIAATHHPEPPMVKRRTQVFVLFALAGAIMLAVGTGAFSTVSAQRTVDVATAGDDSALLELTAHTGPNGQGAYAQQTSGQLEILIDGSLTSGGGVNLNATTTIRDVFNVTNQGSQPVGVWIVKSGPHASMVTFENTSGMQLDNSSSSARTIGVGETLEVSIIIDTTGGGLAAGDTILSDITIYADADQAS